MSDPQIEMMKALYDFDTESEDAGGLGSSALSTVPLGHENLPATWCLDLLLVPPSIHSLEYNVPIADIQPTLSASLNPEGLLSTSEGFQSTLSKREARRIKFTGLVCEKATPTNDPLPARDPSGSTSMYIPNRNQMPGEFGFKMKFDTSAPTHGKLWAFSADKQALHVKINCEFVISFSFERPPPSECELWGLVCYKDNETMLKSPPIAPCSADAKGADIPFLTCKQSSVQYRVLKSHTSVGLQLDSLPVGKDGQFAVFSCPCYSAHMVGHGRRVPEMVLIFSLFKLHDQLVPSKLHDYIVEKTYEEIARDVVTFRCVSTPSRLLDKPGTSSVEATPQPKRRKTSPVRETVALPFHPAFNFVTEEEPDEDGYYTFNWNVKVKDPSEYNFLLMLKKANTK